MKYFLIACQLLCRVATSDAVDVTGIKTANLKGAKIDLMNDHDPEVERTHFTLREGFEVNLFAQEPMVANPIHLAWDAEGRLYVACSWAYPQLKPGETPNDKIIVLEDTDGDGLADRSTVFADKLYIPTGIETANGGVYVAQSPDILFLKDTDGDGVADLREVALTGFGIEDSHHSISAWRRGPGGWIYFQEGIFLNTQVETPYGMVRNYNGGVYQFNPASQELRIFANIGVGNPWGHVFDRWGQSFLVDNPRVLYVTPGTGNGDTKIRIPNLISTEKQCGGDLITGTHFPDDLRGQMLTCRFKSRKVVPYEFTESGSGYSAVVKEPLISSAHPNFRPVDCKIGPDGALYIADWYNPIINHAQHDFRDPRRDFQHGRIWRVTVKGRPLVAVPALAKGGIPSLLDALKSSNTWTRHYARLTLAERDADAVSAATLSWMNGLDAGSAENDHHLLEGLWVLQNIHRPSEAALRKVLQAKDGRARAAAVRVLRYWQVSDPVTLLAAAANDTHPRVRLEAVLAAGFCLDARAMAAALQALDHPRDAGIDQAFPQTVAALRPLWEPALASGELTFARPEHQQFLRGQAGSGTEDLLKRVLKKRAATPSELTQLSQQMLSQRSARQQKIVLNALVKQANKLQPELAYMLLDVQTEIGRTRPFALGKGMDKMTRHLASPDASLVTKTLSLLGVWQRASVAKTVTKIVNDEAQPFAVRRAASEALGSMGRPECLTPLRSLAGSDQSLNAQYLAAFGLVQVDLREAGALTARLFGSDPGDEAVIELVRAFVRISGGQNALADALRERSVHPRVQERIASHVRNHGPLPGRLGRVFAGSKKGSLHQELVAEDRTQLVADVEALGDPVRGEQIYRQAEVACTSCHAIGGAGPHLGPDLAAVGAAATSEYIVESILEPNKAIAEHFENTAVVTADNAFRMGVITFKSEKEIVLRDMTQGGKELRIPKAQIKRTTPMPSLMPSGLADQLNSRQAFLDLAHFVSRLGRAGAYASSDAPVLRTWFRSNETKVYSRVNGLLPAEAFDATLTSYVNVQKPGEVDWVINDARGISLSVDGRTMDQGKPLVLPAGKVALRFAVDRATRGDLGLRVELKNRPGSDARFRVVNE